MGENHLFDVKNPTRQNVMYYYCYNRSINQRVYFEPQCCLLMCYNGWLFLESLDLQVFPHIYQNPMNLAHTSQPVSTRDLLRYLFLIMFNSLLSN